MKLCTVCGSASFQAADVLWPELIAQWQLVPDEVAYINRQQGLTCTNCNCNLRSMALASAITSWIDKRTSFREVLESGALNHFKILEINSAGSLSAEFRGLPGHRLVEYPDFDMHNLKIESDQFNLVIHSDTLEHLARPVAALAECHRVLADDGACIFTAPIVPARMTRSREGLEPSFHGSVNASQTDLMVHWEFGADLWVKVIQAGFRQCCIHSIEYPGGLAITASK